MNDEMEKGWTLVLHELPKSDVKPVQASSCCSESKPQGCSQRGGGIGHPGFQGIQRTKGLHQWNCCVSPGVRRRGRYRLRDDLGVIFHH